MHPVKVVNTLDSINFAIQIHKNEKYQYIPIAQYIAYKNFILSKWYAIKLDF